MSGSPSSDAKYTPPTSMADAEDRLAELTDDCALIQAQLSDQNRTGADGRRLTEREFHEWRARATWALAQKNVAKRRLKRWIDARKQEAIRIEAGIANPTNSVELMAALVQIIKGADWGDLTPREQAICDLARHWIRTRGAPAVVAAREKTEAAS